MFSYLLHAKVFQAINRLIRKRISEIFIFSFQEINLKLFGFDQKYYYYFSNK